MRFFLILIVIFVLGSCNRIEITKQTKEDAKGKESFFNKYLINPKTGVIPKNQDEINLSFIRYKLNTRRTGSNELYDWLQVGPDNIGGRTDAIAIDVRNSNTLMIGGNTGGIWKTTDHGNSWSFKTPPNLSLNVSSIVQHPIDKDVWFFTAGELYKSENNGDSWGLAHSQLNNYPIDKIIIHPQTGHLYVSAGNALYKSTNMGANFSELTNILSSECFQIASDGKIYVIKNSGGGTGGGNPEKGIYVSNDGGNSFNEKKQLSDEILDLSLHIFRISQSNSNIAWLCALEGDDSDIKKLLKFDFSDNTMIDRSENLPEYLITYNGWCFIFEVSPHDPDLLILGGISLHLSEDGFSTPYEMEQNITAQFPVHHADQQAFAWDPNNQNAVWSSHDGGISFADNLLTHNWQNKNNKYRTTQFYRIAIPKGANDKRVVGGTQDNSSPFVNWTDDNYDSPEPPLGDGFSCHFSNSFLITTTQNGKFLVSPFDDEGNPQYQEQGVFQIPAPDALTHPFATTFTLDQDDDKFYYLADRQLWRKKQLSDENSGWDEITTGNFEGPFNYFTLDNSGNTLYYAGIDESNGSKPKLFKLLNCRTALDGAVDITPVDISSANTPISGIALSPKNDQELLICTSGYDASEIYHSIDAGQNFVNVTGNLGENSNISTPSFLSTLISFYQDDSFYWVGTTAGLYVTDKLEGDNTNWSIVAPEKFGLAKIPDLKTRISDGLIAVATYGRGIILGTYNNSNLTNSLNESLDLKVYPNPTNNGIIYIEKPKDYLKGRVMIYNQAGKSIHQQSLDYDNNHLDLSRFPKGTYIINYLSKGNIWSGKIIYK